MDLRSPQQIAR